MLTSRVGCIVQAVIAIALAIVIAFLIYHATSPPRPARSPATFGLQHSPYVRATIYRPGA